LLAIVSQHEKILPYALIAFLEHNLEAEVVIQGPLHIGVGGATDLSLKKISIFLPSSEFSASSVEISVLARSLLSGPLHVKSFHLAEGLLRVNSVPKEEEIDLDPEALLAYLDSGLRHLENTTTQIDLVSMTESQLIYVDPDQDINLRINKTSLTRSAGGKLSLSLIGQFNQPTLAIKAELSRGTPLTQLQLKGEWGEYDIVLDANGPSSRLLLDLLGAEEVRDGQLNHSLTDDDFQFEFTSEGPSLNEASALVDYLDYTELPFLVSGVLTRSDKRLSLDRGQIRLGDGYFEASGTLPQFPALDDWQINLFAKQFDLTVPQPFSPCEIPSLPMDWTGNLSSEGEGLDLGSLTLCIDQSLTKVTPFETSLLLKRLDNGWEIQDWKLSSSILNARAQVHLAINGDVNGPANFSTTNIQKLTSTLEYDAG
jgi:hypothetical protein